MNKGNLILPNDLNTAGIQPDEIDPADALVAVHRRMVSSEQAVMTFRQHLNDAMIEVEMIKESQAKLENEIESLRTTKKDIS